MAAFVACERIGVNNMPYILRHRNTHEVAAAVLRNIHEFDYFGVQWWESTEEAEAEREQFLAKWQYEEPECWDIIQVDEMKVKTMNVKLKNSPAYQVTLDNEGRIAASLRQEM